jgi:L-alanine-DL-glutamate epimerase-like enolase superfamily enzyme
MRITAITSSIVSLPCDMGGPAPTFAGRPWTHLEILLVRVETEDGLVGWGEAFGHAGIEATRTALDTIVAPLVVGRDAGDILGITTEIMQAVHLLGRNGSFVFAFSGVEIALWDLLGKRSGQPLYRLLGGQRRDTLPAYASLLRYTDPDLVARNTAAAVARGYRHVKLHELTVEAVRAARAAADGAKLMLDVNCPWSVPTARGMADALVGDDLMWLEEPVWPPEDVRGLAEVRRRGIPIAAGENVAGLYGFKSLLEAGALDYAQPSVTKIGGIGEVLRVIELCRAHGAAVMPHSPYFGPGFIATIHICAALVERPLVEVLWLEMEANPLDPWVRAGDGQVRVPQGPGLGVDPDPAILSRYTRGAPVTTRARDAKRSAA